MSELQLSKDDEYYGTLALIGAMFRLAAQDYRYGRKKEVEEFLQSEWFEEVCDSLGLELDVVKHAICHGKVKQRMEYH